MKKKAIIGALLLGCGLSISTTSCEDMLSANSDRTIDTNAGDTLYGYWGIMKAIQNIGERYVILGEARGDLVTPTSSVADTINSIATFGNPTDGDSRFVNARDFYAVINNCNNYIARADTNAVNTNGSKKMIKEYAQVLAVRAWTYLQLVNTYGEVPYYTDPITSLDYVDNFNYAKNKLNKDNIIDLLIKDLIKFRHMDLPEYGNYNNGAVSIGSRLTMFPMKLVMGDIYLTGAKDQQDYINAAQCYYDYLKDHGGYLPLNYKTIALGFGNDFMYSSSGFQDAFKTTNYDKSGEVITVIPSSANKLYGTVLTGVCNVFGYSTESSMNTDGEGTGGDDNDDVSTSASVRVSLDPRYRQLGPSNQYFKVNKEQTYCESYTDGVGPEFLEGAGDARQCVITKVNSSFTGSLDFVSKQCVNHSFSYTYPVIYRKSLVWLRFAEAINRAGFPTYAFAVLKDGLCKEYIPSYKEVEKEIIEGNDTIIKVDTIYDNLDKNCYYIKESEYKKSLQAPYSNFLTFTSEFTALNGTEATNIGIHARGCNITAGTKDKEVYTFDNMVNAKLKKHGLVNGKYLTVETAPQKLIQDAVEDVIVDELALETAFEGNRFGDLVRIANHKILAGDVDGVEWFADKIARRGEVYNSADDYTQTVEYKNMKEKLMNPANWFLSLPKP